MQSHTFSCVECNEHIVVGLKINYKNKSFKVLFQENARSSKTEGKIINLDPNFIVPKENLNDGSSFYRLRQMRDMMLHKKKQMDALYGEGAFDALSAVPSEEVVSIHDEWELLRKCWSLKRSRKESLSKKYVAQASQKIYEGLSLDGFEDWLWRFCVRISGPHYENKFKNMIAEIVPSQECGERFEELIEYVQHHIFDEHQGICFDIFKQYFQHYDTFSQAHSYCVLGIDVPPGWRATSLNFDKVKMFYGNAFEALTSLVEILACFNNIIMGRKYSAFERMSLEEYKTIDKAKRSNPFSANLSFSEICDCLNSQIRNASHHGSFELNNITSEINYKGTRSKGQSKKVSYTEYLLLCNKIFLSITLILRMELILTRHFKSS